MDPHVIQTIGEYAFKRIVTGWFIYLLGAAAVLVIFLLSMGGPDPQATFLENKAAALEMIGLAGIVMVMVMGATEIPRDVETQTILILLSKPVSKDDVVLGKFVGLVYVAAFTMLVLSAVCMVGCVAQGMLEPRITQGDVPDVNFLQKVVFSLLQSLIVAGAVILLSTRLSEIPIIAFASFYAFLGFFVFYLRAVLEARGRDIPDLVRLPLYIVYYAIPNLKYLQIPPEQTHKSVIWSHFFLAIIYAIFFTAILLLLALKSFRGREVAG